MAVAFTPDESIPDLTGKVILITGGTAGIGVETIKQLAKHKPAQIFFTGRNTQRANALLKELANTAPNSQFKFLECDHSSLETVKMAADKLLTSVTRLDILICNAGVSAQPPALTKDGYEIQFGINHMSHALFIQKLLPILEKTAEMPGSDVRIILLTSVGFRGHPKGGIVFKDLRTKQDFGAFGSWIRYGQSKLANIVYARELARRFPKITSVSVHPGVVKTNLVKNLGMANKFLVYAANAVNGGKMLDPAQGAYNTLWAASAEKSQLKSGQMYEPVGLLSKKLDAISQDDKFASQLWEWTEKELERY